MIENRGLSSLSDINISFENLNVGDLFLQRWKILGVLGQGGFGIVYHALDLNINGREVAIKILTIDTNLYPEALDRFKQEVSITSKLKSPNVLMIYDFGVIHQYAYMISELLIGQTLDQRIHKEQHISLKESLHIIRTLAQILDEAHELNIVHRDIKPDNIYLNKTKNGYEIKLIDFGIAKMMNHDLKLTATQSFFGTPLYMSPEQIKDSSKVDKRSDIYSLGLVLYTCLTGCPPFESSELYIILKQQMEKNVPKIHFETDKYNDVNHLIFNMTKKDVNNRIQSMKDVIEKIDDLILKIFTLNENIQYEKKEKQLNMKSFIYLISIVICVFSFYLLKTYSENSNRSDEQQTSNQLNFENQISNQDETQQVQDETQQVQDETQQVQDETQQVQDINKLILIDPQKNQNMIVQKKRENIKWGLLKLTSKPPAEVFYMGKSLGWTPIINYRMPVGIQWLRLRWNDLEHDQDISIMIKSNKETLIKYVRP